MNKKVLVLKVVRDRDVETSDNVDQVVVEMNQKACVCMYVGMAFLYTLKINILLLDYTLRRLSSFPLRKIPLQNPPPSASASLVSLCTSLFLVSLSLSRLCR